MKRYELVITECAKCGVVHTDCDGLAAIGSIEGPTCEWVEYDEVQAEIAALKARVEELERVGRAVDVVFDGPPSHISGRFVEVESPPGTGIREGEWLQRKDGYWVLRIQTQRTGVEQAAVAFLEHHVEAHPRSRVYCPRCVQLRDERAREAAKGTT